MQETSFTLEATPVPASRPKVGRGFAYYPRAHTEYANWLKQFLKTVPPFPTEGAVAVSIMFVMPNYKASSAVTYRADVDNLAKLPLDMMTKATTGEGEEEQHRFWKDDYLIVNLQAMKRFAREGEQPHTRVKVKAIDGDIQDYIDEAFNK